MPKKKLIWRQSDLPPYDSDYMSRLATHLWQMKMYWHDARRPIEVKWRECDEAFLCRRILPNLGTMDWIDNRPYGETDIFDNVNILSQRMSLALMPRDYSWLTLSSRQGEVQPMIQALQDQQIFQHYEANTRRSYGRVIKQNIVRGTTALIWDWREERRLRRLTTPESRKKVAAHLKALGANPKDARYAARARVPELLYSGPVMRPVDVYDLWIDPYLDLTNTRQPATIVQTFNYLSDIEATVDDNDNPIYQNLEGLNPFSVEQIYAQDNNFKMRQPEIGGSLPLYGTAPARITGFTKLVPIYIFHLPYLKFEGEEFYDTYFHVALNNGFKWPRIVKIEENPLDNGLSQVLVDNYTDWFTNTGYGISGVEKSLTAYHQKNLLQALWMQGAASAQFPAWQVMVDALRDPSDVSFTPGAIIETTAAALGMDVIKATSVPPGSVQLGQADVRFLAEELRAKQGVDGLAVENAARSSASSRKTATQVNSDDSTGSAFLDEQTEKASWLLRKYCQGVYEATQENLIPDAEGNLWFEKSLQDQVQQVCVPYEYLQVARTVQVNGNLGLLNRKQDMQNKIQALQVTKEVGQLLPNAPAMVQKLWVDVLGSLNVKVDPDDLMSPQQLAAANPQVQMAALQQALQNPQIVQALQQQMHQERQMAFDQQQAQQAQGAPQQGEQANQQQQGQPQAQSVPRQGF